MLTIPATQFNTTTDYPPAVQADWLVVGEIYPDETSEFWRARSVRSRGRVFAQ